MTKIFLSLLCSLKAIFVIMESDLKACYSQAQVAECN